MVDMYGVAVSGLVVLVLAASATANAPWIEQGEAFALYVAQDSTTAETLNQLVLSAIDVDAPPQTLGWAVTTVPAHGTSTVVSGSPSSTGEQVTVCYEPSAGYVGVDDFSLTISDGVGGSDTIVVSVVVASSLYWVDRGHASASDTNPGSESLPWMTVGQAAATLNAGETVLVKSGTYNEQVEPVISGTADQPVTFAVAPGADVTLDGTELGSSPEGFRLDGAVSHVVIDGFQITKFDESIYVLTGPHEGLVFRNLELRENERGMLLRNVVDASVSDSEFHHNRGEGFSATDCADVVVARCYSHDNDDLRGTAGDADGFHAERCDNLLFVDDVAAENSEDGFDLTANVTMLRCVSRGHPAVGVKTWRRGNDGFTARRHRLFNCLIHDNLEAGFKATNGPDVEIYGSVFAHNGEQGVVFRNNEQGGTPDAIVADTLFAWNGGQGLWVGTGHHPHADYNAYWSNGQANTSETEAHSVFSDPQVADEDAREYQLSPSSPLCNTGIDLSSIGLVDDFIRVPRPQDDAYDIGAFELVSE
jgi:hypothetical protein